MAKRIAVIMAGGSGERFWPVSTRAKPKQFLNLADPASTLLEQSVERAIQVAGKDNTYIATASNLAQLSADTTGLSQTHIFAEPCKRNTAGCLVWVAANLIAENQDWKQTTLAVLTADQKIGPMSSFERTADIALSAAEEHQAIAIIGIKPDRPETGFGYIELGDSHDQAHWVKQFREKPSRATAEEYLQSGNYLWNSGMFFYTLETFMSELETHQPEMASVTLQIAAEIQNRDMAKATKLFESLPNISIDFAIMEKAKRVIVVEASFEWDDLGTWDSLERSYSQDENGNVVHGDARLVDSSGNIIYCDDTSLQINLLGIKDSIVVATGSEIMICPKSRAQEVKRFLEDPPQTHPTSPNSDQPD